MTTLEKIRAEIEEVQKNTIDWSRSVGMIDALEIIDKYAEQEPCDDVVSRQAVLDYLEANADDFHDYHEAIEKVLELPSVRPQQNCEDIAKAFQFGMALGFGEKYDEMDRVIDEIKKVIIPKPKTGHWIKNAEEWDNINPPYICSECMNAETRERKSCSECGAKMIEPQESEDKE